MKSRPVVVVALCLAAALAAPGSAAAEHLLLERPAVTTVAATEARTVVQVAFPVSGDPAATAVAWRRPPDRLEEKPGESRTLPERLRLLVALPGEAPPAWRVTAVAWRRPPGGAVDWSAAVSVGPPVRWRGIVLRAVAVDPLAFGTALPAALTLELDHPPDAAGRRLLGAGKRTAAAGVPAAPAWPDGLVNRPLAARLLRSAAAAAAAKARDETGGFRRSEHWLRVAVDTTGVYRLTADALAAAGVAAAGVDPAKLRLFRAWPRPLPADPEAPGSWQEGWDGLAEVPLLLEDDDGVWGTGDALQFFAVAADAWQDRIDPGADPLTWRDHPYSGTAVYWLTWEDYQAADPWPAPPLRLADVAATPAGGPVVDSVRQRLHLEKSYVEVYGRLADNWAWDVAISGRKTIPFTLRDPVPGADAVFRIALRSYRQVSHSGAVVNRATAWLNDGDQQGETATREWTVASESDSLDLYLTGHGTTLRDGDNTLVLRRDSGPEAPLLILDAVDLLYRRRLVKRAGQQAAVHWGDEVAQAGPVELRVAHAGRPAPMVWDVTEPDAPRRLLGVDQGDTLRLGVARTPGTALHLQLVEPGEERAALSLSLRRPDRLRALAPDLDEVIVYGEGMAAAAQRLAAHRRGRMRGVAEPAAAAVAAADIYDAFGGGVKDPLAIRNFCRWIWLRGGGRLAYLCLLGDASRDYRNYGNSLLADVVPTVVRTSFPRPVIYYTNRPYPSDDALVSFDSPPYAGAVDAPDLAVGRLPAQTAVEADAMVDRIIAYENEPPAGTWRNTVVMAADDFYQPSNQNVQPDHQEEAEYLVDAYLPPSLDVRKIYLSDYDYQSPSSFYKPLARQDARAAWHAGLTFFHYIGHGADNTLADEQIFLTQDIYTLGNGLRRGLFLAFSCDVGIFDSPLRQSMAEVFVSQAEGGAIGAICAAQVSYIGPNNALSEAFYGALYPGRAVTDSTTPGAALAAAKVAMAAWGQSYMTNSQRYHLFTDPALALPQPRTAALLAAGTLDTLATGRRERVVCDLDALGLDPARVDGYDLLVRESRRVVVQDPDAAHHLVHWLPGGPAFLGSGMVDGDTLVVPFKTPLQIRTGPTGRVRLLLWTADGGLAQAVTVPVAAVATGAVDDVAGPRISMAFADGRRRVKAGATLSAVLEDSSGVSILGTTPLNSILLEFDGSGLMTDVSPLFRYDPGSYTRGSLQLTVPGDLAAGPHVVALHASDGLGNTASDTLAFHLVPGEVTRLYDVTPFPNPSDGPVRLLFELSDPMTVEWTIFTLDGHPIHRQRHVFTEAGPAVLRWDGRDDRGDRPANGVYIYVLKGRRADDAAHPVTVTGRLVVMR